MSRFNGLLFIFLCVSLLPKEISATEQSSNQYEQLTEEEKQLIDEIVLIKLTKEDLPPSAWRKICCYEINYSEEEILEKLLKTPVDPEEVIKNAEKIEYDKNELKKYQTSSPEGQDKDKQTINGDVNRTSAFWGLEDSQRKKYENFLKEILFDFVDEKYGYYQSFNQIFGIAIILTLGRGRFTNGKNEQVSENEKKKVKELAYKILFSEQVHLYKTFLSYLKWGNDNFSNSYEEKIKNKILKESGLKEPGHEILYSSFAKNQMWYPLCFCEHRPDVSVRVINLFFKYGYKINFNILEFFWDRLQSLTIPSTAEVQKKIEGMGIS